jgi:hypothetical protein
MLEPEIATSIAQLGAAGLIGWMWLAERRAGAAREAQLRELHDRLMQERPQITTLLSVVQDNTRALAALDAGQRTLASAMERLCRIVEPAPSRHPARTGRPPHAESRPKRP